MKISELIQKLQELQTLHGDVAVMVIDAAEGEPTEPSTFRVMATLKNGCQVEAFDEAEIEAQRRRNAINEQQLHLWTANGGSSARQREQLQEWINNGKEAVQLMLNPQNPYIMIL